MPFPEKWSPPLLPAGSIACRFTGGVPWGKYTTSSSSSPHGPSASNERGIWGPGPSWNLLHGSGESTITLKPWMRGRFFDTGVPIADSIGGKLSSNLSFSTSSVQAFFLAVSSKSSKRPLIRCRIDFFWPEEVFMGALGLVSAFLRVTLVTWGLHPNIFNVLRNKTDTWNRQLKENWKWKRNRKTLKSSTFCQLCIFLTHPHWIESFAFIHSFESFVLFSLSCFFRPSEHETIFSFHAIEDLNFNQCFCLQVLIRNEFVQCLIFSTNETIMNLCGMWVCVFTILCMAACMPERLYVCEDVSMFVKFVNVFGKWERRLNLDIIR